MQYICVQCTKPFNAPPSQKARFCNRSCYDKYRKGSFKCLNCQKEFIHYKSRKRKFCSNKCQRKYIVGENHYHWKGGKTIQNNGYMFIYQPNHPFATNRRVREHRFVVEQKIGRYLESSEIVHHINHNKLDNRIENLIILTRAEHCKIHPPK